MAALLALICFVVALFGGSLRTIHLVTLGLAFVALHLLVGAWPFGGRR